VNGRRTNGIFFDSAILNDEWAKPAIDYPPSSTLRPPPNSNETGTDIIGVIHRKGHAFTLEIIHVQRGRCAAVLWRIHELELARARRNKVRRAVLVTERVTTDHDRVDPSRYGPRDTLEDDWFAEDGATDDVADLCARKESGRRATSAKGAVMRTERMKKECGKKSGSARTEGCEPLLVRDPHSPPPGASTYGAIGRAPHLLQLEFLHPRLIWRDGCALNTDVVLEDRLG